MTGLAYLVHVNRHPRKPLPPQPIYWLDERHTLHAIAPPGFVRQVVSSGGKSFAPPAAWSISGLWSSAADGDLFMFVGDQTWIEIRDDGNLPEILAYLNDFLGAHGYAAAQDTLPGSSRTWVSPDGHEAIVLERQAQSDERWQGEPTADTDHSIYIVCSRLSAAWDGKRPVGAKD